MGKIIDFLISIFYPNKCIFCGEELEYDKIMCSKCSENIKEINPEICSLCKKENCECENELDRIVSLYNYDALVGRAIKDLKFKSIKINANKLSTLIYSYLMKTNFINKIDVVIPVPMYEKDVEERGYNQSVLIAEDLVEKLDIELDIISLIKIRETEKQHNLTENERKENLFNAFSLSNKDLLKDKTVLLLDDVCTTGTTLSECAKEIKKAGVREIYGITIAKTVEY